MFRSDLFPVINFAACAYPVCPMAYGYGLPHDIILSLVARIGMTGQQHRAEG